MNHCHQHHHYQGNPSRNSQSSTPSKLFRHISLIMPHTSDTSSAEKSFPDNNDDDEILPMGGGKPYPRHYDNRAEYIVTFDGPSDKWSPQNWSSRKKYVQTPRLDSRKEKIGLTNAPLADSTLPQSYAVGPLSHLSTALFSPRALLPPVQSTMSDGPSQRWGQVSSSWASRPAH